MESKVNYTMVGLFVSLLIVGLFGFAYWLTKYTGGKEYEQYYVYVSESVAGLNRDSSVKYKGVSVGTVERLRINPNNAEQVEILLKVERGTPIRVGTTATLMSFGVTGLVFVELSSNSKDASLLQETKDGVAIIPSTPSRYTEIGESMRQLSDKFTQALDNFDLLLSKENLNNLAGMLSETKLLAKDIREQVNALQPIIENGVRMEQSITGSAEEVKAASASIKKLANSLEKNYAGVNSDLNHEVQQSLRSFNQLLEELNLLAGEVQETVRQLGNSPSDLLFKHREPKPGPGEAGYHEN